MPTQKRNSNMVDLLTPDFQRRYEPNFAIGNAVSTLLALQNLRGMWPMSSVNEAGDVYSLSGQGRILTNTGTAPFGTAGLVSYISFDGATQYLYRVTEAGLNVTGALTIGGWFLFTALGAGVAVTGKWNPVGNQRAYSIQKSAGDAPTFYVSADGTANVSVASTVAVPSVSAWAFIVGRYTPATELAIWHNNTKTVNVAGIPAAIFSSTSRFSIGALGDATLKMTGRASFCFLCSAALTDAVITNLYEQTRAAFGR